MTPRDLITRLEAEGVTATLKLKLEGDNQPSPETFKLLQAHRDDLIIYLALQHGDTPRMCRVSEELQTGAQWCGGCFRYHLQPCASSKKRFEEAN